MRVVKIVQDLIIINVKAAYLVNAMVVALVHVNPAVYLNIALVKVAFYAILLSNCV